MLLAQNAIRDELKEKVEQVAANENASEEVKAACKEYLDTFTVGATNGTATDKLVAALEGIDCPTCKYIVAEQELSWLRSPSGYSVVTDGLTISASAA